MRDGPPLRRASLMRQDAVPRFKHLAVRAWRKVLCVVA